MPKPILSRFDLVFILRDRADKALDQRVSSNIVNLYRSKVNPAKASSMPETATFPSTTNMSLCFTERKNSLPILERLAWVHDFQKQPLPASLVRDYIAYAREYCKPKLTKDAAIILKKYFIQLRYGATSCSQRKQDTVPITTRQLEALIRLCQARAKACLRDFVLPEDALDVVELMSISVDQVHRDEGGSVDRGRGGAGGKSNRKMKKAFAFELRRIVGVGSECSKDDLRRISDKVNCGLNEFNDVVEDLRNDGTLMKKANGRYQVSR